MARDYKAEYEKRKSAKPAAKPAKKATAKRKYKKRDNTIPLPPPSAEYEKTKDFNYIRGQALLTGLDRAGLKVMKDRLLTACKASLANPSQIPETIPCADGTTITREMFLHNCSYIVSQFTTY